MVDRGGIGDEGCFVNVCLHCMFINLLSHTYFVSMQLLGCHGPLAKRKPGQAFIDAPTPVGGVVEEEVEAVEE